VLDISVIRSKSMRGQAHITMSSIPESSAALSALQGFSLFDKPLRVQFAREKSDRVLKHEGKYRPAEVKAARAEKRAAKAQALAAAAAEPAAKKAKEGEAAFDAAAEPTMFLWCPGLPAECDADMLEVLFEPYSGFVRAAAPKPGLGFVEFVDDAAAKVAKEALQGFKLTPTEELQVFYGKK
jgi:U2 small nuclear ribonucleoprotein B''